MGKVTSLKRFGAGFLAFVVLLTNSILCHAAETNLWKDRQNALQLAQASFPIAAPINRSIPPSSSLTADIKQRTSTSIPLMYGRLQSVQSPSTRKSKGTILHIQDIHLNAEAQANIGKAVAAWSKQNPESILALEGVFEALPIERIKSVLSPEAQRKAADYMLSENQISGPVHAALVEPVAPFVIGVDDKQHYEANVDAYRQSIELKPAASEELNRLKKEMAAEKNRVFSAELAEFDAKVEAYREKNENTGAYLKWLNARSDGFYPQIQMFVAASELEASIHFAQVENDRRHMLERLVNVLTPAELSRFIDDGILYRTGELSAAHFFTGLKNLCDKNQIPLQRYAAFQDYLRYVSLVDRIDGDQLIQQQTELEKLHYEKLAVSGEEKKLVRESRRLYLMGKLIEFALTSEEWNEFKNVRHSGGSRNPERTLPLKEVGILDPGFRRGDSELHAFEKFYTHAELRDQKMAENLIRQLHGSAILVTGGFHSKGINKKLVDAGYSVTNFIPNVTKVDASAGSEYLSIFSREKTPLEKLFAGQKLFLSPPQEQGLRYMTPFGRAEMERTGQPTGVKTKRHGNNVDVPIDGKMLCVGFNSNGSYLPLSMQGKSHTVFLGAYYIGLLTVAILQGSSRNIWILTALAILPFFILPMVPMNGARHEPGKAEMEELEFLRNDPSEDAEFRREELLEILAEVADALDRAGQTDQAVRIWNSYGAEIDTLLKEKYQNMYSTTQTLISKREFARAESALGENLIIRGPYSHYAKFLHLLALLGYESWSLSPRRSKELLILSLHSLRLLDRWETAGHLKWANETAAKELIGFFLKTFSSWIIESELLAYSAPYLIEPNFYGLRKIFISNPDIERLFSKITNIQYNALEHRIKIVRHQLNKAQFEKISDDKIKIYREVESDVLGIYRSFGPIAPTNLFYGVITELYRKWGKLDPSYLNVGVKFIEVEIQKLKESLPGVPESELDYFKIRIGHLSANLAEYYLKQREPRKALPLLSADNGKTIRPYIPDNYHSVNLLVAVLLAIGSSFNVRLALHQLTLGEGFVLRPLLKSNRYSAALLEEVRGRLAVADQSKRDFLKNGLKGLGGLALLSLFSKSQAQEQKAVNDPDSRLRADIQAAGLEALQKIRSNPKFPNRDEIMGLLNHYIIEGRFEITDEGFGQRSSHAQVKPDSQTVQFNRTNFGKLSTEEMEPIIVHEMVHLTREQGRLYGVGQDLAANISKSRTLEPLMKNIAIQVHKEIEAYDIEKEYRSMQARERDMTPAAYMTQLAVKAADPSMAGAYVGIALLMEDVEGKLTGAHYLSVMNSQAVSPEEMKIFKNLVETDRLVPEGKTFDEWALTWLQNPNYYNPPEYRSRQGLSAGTLAAASAALSIALATTWAVRKKHVKENPRRQHLVADAFTEQWVWSWLGFWLMAPAFTYGFFRQFGLVGPPNLFYASCLILAGLILASIALHFIPAAFSRNRFIDSHEGWMPENIFKKLDYRFYLSGRYEFFAMATLFGTLIGYGFMIWFYTQQPFLAAVVGFGFGQLTGITVHLINNLVPYFRWEGVLGASSSGSSNIAFGESTVLDPSTYLHESLIPYQRELIQSLRESMKDDLNYVLSLPALFVTEKTPFWNQHDEEETFYWGLTPLKDGEFVRNRNIHYRLIRSKSSGGANLQEDQPFRVAALNYRAGMIRFAADFSNIKLEMNNGLGFARLLSAVWGTWSLPDISIPVAIKEIHSVARAGRTQPIFDYFYELATSNPDQFKEIVDSINMIRQMEKREPFTDTSVREVVTEFLKTFRPVQMVDVNNSAIRVNILNDLLTRPEARESYFHKTGQVQNRENVIRLIDRLLRESFSTYEKPTYDGRIDEQKGMVVSEIARLYIQQALRRNRWQADELYLNSQAILGRLLGTLLAVGGTTKGEAIAYRNVGVRKGRVIMGDYDLGHFPNLSSERFDPELYIEGVRLDFQEVMETISLLSLALNPSLFNLKKGNKVFEENLLQALEATADKTWHDSTLLQPGYVESFIGWLQSDGTDKYKLPRDVVNTLLKKASGKSPAIGAPDSLFLDVEQHYFKSGETSLPYRYPVYTNGRHTVVAKIAHKNWYEPLIERLAYEIAAYAGIDALRVWLVLNNNAAHSAVEYLPGAYPLSLDEIELNSWFDPLGEDFIHVKPSEIDYDLWLPILANPAIMIQTDLLRQFMKAGEFGARQVLVSRSEIVRDDQKLFEARFIDFESGFVGLPLTDDLFDAFLEKERGLLNRYAQPQIEKLAELTDLDIKQLIEKVFGSARVPMKIEESDGGFKSVKEIVRVGLQKSREQVQKALLSIQSATPHFSFLGAYLIFAAPGNPFKQLSWDLVWDNWMEFGPLALAFFVLFVLLIYQTIRDRRPVKPTPEPELEMVLITPDLFFDVNKKGGAHQVRTNLPSTSWNYFVEFKKNQLTIRIYDPADIDHLTLRSEHGEIPLMELIGVTKLLLSYSPERGNLTIKPRDNQGRSIPNSPDFLINTDGVIQRFGLHGRILKFYEWYEEDIHTMISFLEALAAWDPFFERSADLANEIRAALDGAGKEMPDSEIDSWPDSYSVATKNGDESEERKKLRMENKAKSELKSLYRRVMQIYWHTFFHRRTTSRFLEGAFNMFMPLYWHRSLIQDNEELVALMRESDLRFKDLLEVIEVGLHEENWNRATRLVHSYLRNFTSNQLSVPWTEWWRFWKVYLMKENIFYFRDSMELHEFIWWFGKMKKQINFLLANSTDEWVVEYFNWSSKFGAEQRVATTGIVKEIVEKFLPQSLQLIQPNRSDPYVFLVGQRRPSPGLVPQLLVYVVAPYTSTAHTHSVIVELLRAQTSAENPVRRLPDAVQTEDESRVLGLQTLQYTVNLEGNDSVLDQLRKAGLNWKLVLGGMAILSAGLLNPVGLTLMVGALFPRFDLPEDPRQAALKRALNELARVGPLGVNGRGLEPMNADDAEAFRQLIQPIRALARDRDYVMPLAKWNADLVRHIRAEVPGNRTVFILVDASETVLESIEGVQVVKRDGGFVANNRVDLMGIVDALGLDQISNSIVALPPHTHWDLFGLSKSVLRSLHVVWLVDLFRGIPIEGFDVEKWISSEQKTKTHA